MKIVIVGTGISGLVAYHFLDRFLKPLIPDVEINAYESYKSPSVGIGGTLGLAANGLYTIKLISEDAHAKILASGFPCAKFEMRNSKGKVLGLMSSGSPERYAGTGGQIMHSRAGVYEEILKVLEEQGAKIHYGKTVTSVTQKDKILVVQFADGEVVNADMVIGADGIKSPVRKTAFPGVNAQFENLLGIGSTIPSTAIAKSELPREIPYDYKSTTYSPTVMTFGSNGFFGYSPVNSKTGDEGRYQWWSTAETTDENRDLSIDEIEKQLLERHKGWVNPKGEHVIEDIIKYAVQQHKDSDGDRTKRILVLPNYHAPKMEKYHSDDGRIILMGDAAHVMPPHSGQGVSQAAEDGYAFAKILASEIEAAQKANSNDFSQAIQNAGKLYTELRKPRIELVLWTASKAGNMKRNLNWFDEMCRDFFFGMFLKFAPEKMNDGILGYRVDEEVEKLLAGKKK